MRFLLLLFCIAITACASNSQMHNSNASLAPTDKARIYFFRDSGNLYSLRAPTIKINDQEIGSAKNHHYFFIDKEPGSLDVVAETWEPGKYEVTLNVLAGKTYYIEVAPRSESVIPSIGFGMLGLYADSKISENSGLFKLTPADENDAKNKIAGLKQIATK